MTRGGMDRITVYGALWCADCRRSKRFLDRHAVEYTWVDTDADPEGAATIERLQEGGRSIPTILFPDGSFLVEPSDATLGEKLGIVPEA